jgi:hypothetical protein
LSLHLLQHQNLLLHKKGTDMSMLRIQVTQEDIDSGKQSSTDNCAIARALKRQLGLNFISVSGLAVMIGGFYYESPDAISRFVHDFDKDKTLVFPQELLLDRGSPIPQSYVFS